MHNQLVQLRILGSTVFSRFNALQLRLNWVYDYQFNAGMIVAFSFEKGYSRREALLSDFEDETAVIELPENNFIYAYPGILALWSF